MANNIDDKRPYFSAYARPSQQKKTMAAFANQISAEEDGAVDRRYFSSVYVRDNDHTMGAIERIAKKLRVKKVAQMKKYLLENCKYVEDGRYKYFKDVDLFAALTSVEDGARMCEIKKLKSWEDVIVYLN